MDFSEVLRDVGEFGKYQRLLLSCVLLPCLVPCAFHTYSQIFMASVPDHWCHIPELDSMNWTVEEKKAVSIPLERKGNRQFFSKCRQYNVNFTAVMLRNSQPNASWPTSECQCTWEYDRSQRTSSVVTKWDLVCSSDWYPTLALSLFGAAGFVGNCIFHCLQDRVGYRISFFSFLFIECVFGVATAFAPNFLLWVIFRVGVGSTVPAVAGAPFVLAVELVGHSKRAITIIITNIGYSIALVILAVIVWFIKEWQTLALVTTFPLFIIFIFWRVFPESPSWLLANGRIEEAISLTIYIARTNEKSLPPDYLINLKRRLQVEYSLLHSDTDRGKRANGYSVGLWSLFQPLAMFKITTIVTFIWFTSNSAYIGLSYYAPSLEGDEHLAFLLSTVVEIPTYLFVYISMEYWNIRWMLSFSLTVAGISTISTTLVTNNHLAILILYCVGKFSVTTAFVILPLVAMDLYPVIVRKIGLSFSSMMAMIGPSVVPFINYLGGRKLTLPLVAMGMLLLCSGASSLALLDVVNENIDVRYVYNENLGFHWRLCSWIPCCLQQLPTQEDTNDSSVVESPLRSLLECQETLSIQNELLSERDSVSDKTSQSEETMRITVM